MELDFYKSMKEEQMRDILRSYCLLQARIAKAVSVESSVLDFLSHLFAG